MERTALVGSELPVRSELPVGSESPAHSGAGGFAVATPPVDTGPAGPAELLAEDDLLVEDVSIDGMCGVY
jgi:mycofactocin precursor